MSACFTLWKRETASYFLSPVAYILATMFLVVMGVGFWFIASVRLVSGASIYDLFRGLYGAVAWAPILIVVPVLSMRSFAEENRAGTLETLLTAPVTDAEVVLAKFAGLCTVYTLIWLPTLCYIPLLNALNGSPIPLDTGALTGAGIGLFLIGSFFLSIGLFCSALTHNLIIASISTFAIIFLIFLAGFLPEVSPVPALRQLSAPFSPVLHMLEFSRGVMDTRPIVLYLSSTFFVLSATTRVLESRRWRA